MRCQDHPKREMSRAEFLRLAVAYGTAGAISTWLQACTGNSDLSTIEAPPSPTQTHSPPKATNTGLPSLTQEPTKVPTDQPTQTLTATSQPAVGTARVAFVKTRDRIQGVQQAMEMLGKPSIEGKKVYLKPNFNSPDPTPGSTHPDVLRTLVEQLNFLGADQITIGDRSGMGDTRQVMRSLGVFDMAEELNFKTLVFDDLSRDDWMMLDSPGSHWKKGFPFARPILEAEAIVQTCCLKTHRYGGHFTLSLKNSVGMVGKLSPRDGYNYMNELHNSPHQRRMIAEINTAYQPDLIILDGVEAFVNGGPDQGKRVQSEVVLAGTDRVAIDAVGVALLRYFGTTREVSQGKIFKQDQIDRAVKLGLGVDSPEKIELVTADAKSAEYAEQIREVLQKG